MLEDELPPSLLRELIDYDPAQGSFGWAEPKRSWFLSDAHWAAYLAGKSDRGPFSSEHTAGYMWGGVAGHQVLAHRAAWAYCYDAWPSGEIDHINHNRKDNRLLNLREVGRTGNARNASRSRSNTSGVTGVYWDSQRKKWVAQIALPQGRAKHLGRYADFDAAVAARKAAEREYGFHENHGQETQG